MATSSNNNLFLPLWVHLTINLFTNPVLHAWPTPEASPRNKISEEFLCGSKVLLIYHQSMIMTMKLMFTPKASTRALVSFEVEVRVI
jgi:hypothetical protein